MRQRALFSFPRRRPAALLALLASFGSIVALWGTAAGALGASAGLVPTCPGSELTTMLPHPDCVFRPWASPLAAHIDGTATLTKPPTREGKTWNMKFTVTVKYNPPYKQLCNPAGTQAADIPCQFPGPSFSIPGAYLPHGTTFQGPSPYMLSKNCPDLSGTCVETFDVNVYSVYGRLVFIVNMSLNYLTKNPGNVNGFAGFEVPLVVTLPKLKGASPTRLNK